MHWRMTSEQHGLAIRPFSAFLLRLATALALALSLSGVVGAGSSAVAGAITPGGPFVHIVTDPPGSPVTDGDFISVQVPPNRVLRSGIPLVIEECAAPGFGRPFSFNNCDGTTRQLGRVFAGRNGSLTYADYEIVSLPVTTSSHRSFRHGPVCDSTHACVLVVRGSFGKSNCELWSHPFFVGPAVADPGNGTPEVPYVLVLPILAVTVFGGSMLLRRRRSATPKTS
jgi:hypothetical protein